MPRPATEIRSPRRYRPRLHPKPAMPQETRRDRTSRAAVKLARGPLDANLVLFFRPGGWGIQTSLLFRRTPDMAEDVSVRCGLAVHELNAISDEHFAPVPIGDPADALASGIAAESIAEPIARWVRGGRDLHVFAARTGVAGFVTAARVIMGHENAILCTSAVVAPAVGACKAAGGPDPQEISGPGIPDGWRCFRGIRPTLAGAIDGLDENCQALIPHPLAAIEFGGGIPLSNGAWLSGHPPSICISGDTPAAGVVAIDGKPATCIGAGDYIAEGWDAVGSHTVSYAGLSRSYSIAHGLDSWEPWPAHTLGHHILCGALALGHRELPTAYAAEPGSVWLIGSRPGEVQQALTGQNRTAVIAAPSFVPVWAIALRSSRGRDRHDVHLIGKPAAPSATGRFPTQSVAVRNWCHILRAAGSRPASLVHSHAEQELWSAYRAHASSVRRRGR